MTHSLYCVGHLVNTCEYFILIRALIRTLKLNQLQQGFPPGRGLPVAMSSAVGGIDLTTEVSHLSGISRTITCPAENGGQKVPKMWIHQPKCGHFLLDLPNTNSDFFAFTGHLKQGFRDTQFCPKMEHHTSDVVEKHLEFNTSVRPWKVTCFMTVQSFYLHGYHFYATLHSNVIFPRVTLNLNIIK